MPDLQLPLTFRSEIIKPLLAKLYAGESCALVGVGSVGKGNIARHLQREDVRAHFFPQDAPRILWLYVDCNRLSHNTELDLYAEILNVLGKELHKSGAAFAAIETQIMEWWRESIISGNPSLVRHHLESAVDAVLEGPVQQIVLMLDDCDALIVAAPTALLRGLRALRDDHKQRLVYMTVTRRELARLREMSQDFQAFFELFASNTLGIKPYRESDAIFMLERLAARQQPFVRSLSDAEIKRLLELSGSHAGLIKHIYAATRYGERVLDPNIIPYLIQKQVIWSECEKIWESLEDFELADLQSVALRQPPSGKGIPPLKVKGLVIENSDRRLSIFSRIFEAFVAAKAGVKPLPGGPKIDIDPATRRITIDARSIQLTPVEFELFQCLYDQRPEPCPYDQLINRLMVIDPGGNPHRRLDQHMTQLREKTQSSGVDCLIALPDHRWRLVGEDGQ